MIWNLPNTLTATRIVLIPFFIGLSYLPGRWGLILSAVLFSLAALTDWADGYIARREGLLTDFGRFFDPVADKLLVISAFVLLLALNRAPLILVLTLLAREITIMALRERMAGLGVSIRVSGLAKWKTGFQMTAIIMLLVQDGLFGIPFQWPGLFFLFVAVVFSLWSGYRYVVAAWPQIQPRT
ncbi:MAG: CDP-diacylglycerol--glycerol-3-phosphate 3-phosphatidyltransferase [Magnetococcales bacterium]|nr:CDP-diacylglycerol--glycerol-3-phosphate 3-phosphatidyltransferase [Magnetococcales bacterium]MBF0438283.1 CDP-diacylglycerol--glycerol-3-phosphate 3-phosphatidyltransferase [Magnetococcales bacterium]